MVVRQPSERDDIAIVGIGCRLPARIDSPEAFWAALHNGVDAIGPVPEGRLDARRYLGASGESEASPGGLGGFLEDIERFDAGFFGISPREAQRVDPQQRLLLETTWQALEDAAIPVDELAGSRTGVFVGLWLQDYESRLFRDPEQVDFHMTTGTGRYAASGRISHALSLHGPSLTVDTACSSSLVAVHLACRSLQVGDCTLAVAGGANVLLEPQITVAYARAGMLSADGRSKFGDARADGYVRSEGAGMVVLKPLARAHDDGDPIYAVVRGGAVNNDGGSGGQLVAPARSGQEEMLRLAWEDAGIEPSRAAYVEAHGTGTLVGDPVELEAIGSVLGTGRRPEEPCLVGSVKTNLGHTEGAAGVAGLIKAALILQRRTVPASLHFERPNPAIDWDGLGVRIASQLEPLPVGRDGESAVGVSAFGITGTNAHLVLQTAPESAPTDVAATTKAAPTSNEAPLLVPLSARSSESLQAMATQTAEWARSLDPSSFGDLARTLSTRRARHEHRLAVVAPNAHELAATLDGFAAGALREEAAVASGRAVAQPRVVFVFPGQGSQWTGMGRQLAVSEPVFRAALEACQDAMAPWVEWSLLDQISLDEDDPAWALDRIDVIQPVLVALEIALARLLGHWGVTPSAVIGHSMGEVAAAHFSGALSLADAFRVICVRSRLLRRVSGRGGMAVVQMAAEDLERDMARYGDALSVAAANSPRSTVLSGDPEALDELLETLSAREIFCRRIAVDVASHSRYVDELTDDLLDALAGLSPSPARVPLASTVTDGWLDGLELTPSYWARNLRQPVRFAATATGLRDELAGEGALPIFLEVSPHPVLVTALDETLRAGGGGGVALGTLRRDQDETWTFGSALGQLWVRGVELDFRSMGPDGRRLRIPPYPWHRERHWIEDTREELAVPTDWLRDVAWRRSAAAHRSLSETPAASLLWIVHAEDEDPLGSAVLRALEGLGFDCRSVVDADAVAEAISERGPAGARVLRIPSPTASDPPSTGEAILAKTQRECLDLVRVIARVGSGDESPDVRLWIVTRGAQAVSEDDRPDPVHSALWGLGRVAALEMPEVWGGLLDLPVEGQALDEAAETAIRRIALADGEGEIVEREGVPYVSRLVPAEPLVARDPELKKNATYLVVGGLGSIGLRLARWLAERGAGHLVLVGRSGLPPRKDWKDVPADAPVRPKLDAVEAIEQIGAEVTVAAADVTDEVAMTALFARMREELPPLRGIVHAAAWMEFAPLVRLQAPELDAGLRAKVAGSWILHRLSTEEDLDHFVLFSSISSVWGSRGLGAYAAANHFLDGLAHHRRSLGLPALSVNWGGWEGGSTSTEVSRFIETSDVRPLPAQAAFRALGSLMEGRAVRKIVATMDWASFARGFALGANPRFVSEIAASDAGERPRSTSTKETPFVASLRASPASAPGRLEERVRAEAASVLGMSPEALMEPGQGFVKLGMDSLMNVDLRGRLERVLGLDLPTTIAFECPTVGALAAFLAKSLELVGDRGDTRSPRTDVVPTRSATVPAEDGLDDLSEEELARQLDMAIEAASGDALS